MQDNPKVTNIAINAQGGAMTLIVGTILSSKIEVVEDPAFNNGAQQGLQGYYMDPSPGVLTRSPNVLQTWLPNGTGGRGPAYEPITLGGTRGRYTGAAGTPLLELTTNSANAGGVLLVEYPESPMTVG